ncbi:ovalbumin-like [Rhipicephalus sanguineus]|uniref:ovalbumin-like n=1 Tax=Rhipicephalus sanguineus TaxID=34632 RepID=UPI0020C49FC3|nr:ovalbumin-like [Rhipicephalus sanguineus]
MSSTVIEKPAVEPRRTTSDTTTQLQHATKEASGNPVVTALNKLGLYLFQKAAEHLDHNVLLCPAAVTASLLTTLGCAEAETHLQFLELLVKEGGKLEHLQAAVFAVFDTLEKDKANAEAALIYRMFVSRHVMLNETCEELLKTQLRCCVDRVSFHTSTPEDIAYAVNGSFADGSPLIGEVLAPEAVDITTNLLVASAFHYRGILEPPFTRNTEARSFKPTVTTEVSLEFEQGAGSFMYGEIGDTVSTKVLELPYRGGAVSLLLLLPDRARLLKDLLAQLTPAFLARVAGCLKPKKVHVKFPHATIEARYDNVTSVGPSWYITFKIKTSAQTRTDHEEEMRQAVSLPNNCRSLLLSLFCSAPHFCIEEDACQSSARL